MSVLPRPLPEPIPGQAEVVDLVERIFREDSRRLVEQLALVGAGDPVQETRLRDNVFLLAPGDHGGANLSIDGTHVQGLPGARFTRQVVVDPPAGRTITFDGVEFDSTTTKGEQLPLVDIGANARVVFRGCRFVKHPDHTGAFVDIAAGGRVNFLGCAFLRGDGATSVVNNAGVAADVQVAFGINLTGVLSINVTATGEIT